MQVVTVISLGIIIGFAVWAMLMLVNTKLIKMETQVKSVEVVLSIHILQLTSSPFLK